MYQVSIIAMHELPGNSPFHFAKLQIEGGYCPPELQDRWWWYEFFSLTTDLKVLFVAGWAGNDEKRPSFRLYRFDDPEASVKISQVYPGLCKSVTAVDSQSARIGIWKHGEPDQELSVSEWQPYVWEDLFH